MFTTQKMIEKNSSLTNELIIFTIFIFRSTKKDSQEMFNGTPRMFKNELDQFVISRTPIRYLNISLQ